MAKIDGMSELFVIDRYWSARNKLQFSYEHSCEISRGPITKRQQAALYARPSALEPVLNPAIKTWR